MLQTNNKQTNHAGKNITLLEEVIKKKNSAYISLNLKFLPRDDTKSGGWACLQYKLLKNSLDFLNCPVLCENWTLEVAPRSFKSAVASFDRQFPGNLSNSALPENYECCERDA